jgi:hypothetical protein
MKLIYAKHCYKRMKQSEQNFERTHDPLSKRSTNAKITVQANKCRMPSITLYILTLIITCLLASNWGH